MSLVSSVIPLPTLTLMVFPVYVFWIVVIKCVGIPLLDIIVHSLSVHGVKGLSKINKCNVCVNVKFSMFLNYLGS